MYMTVDHLEETNTGWVPEQVNQKSFGATLSKAFPQGNNLLQKLINLPGLKSDVIVNIIFLC